MLRADDDSACYPRHDEQVSDLVVSSAPSCAWRVWAVSRRHAIRVKLYALLALWSFKLGILGCSASTHSRFFDFAFRMADLKLVRHCSMHQLDEK